MQNLVLLRNFIAKHSALSTFCDCVISDESGTWNNTNLCVANDCGTVHILDTNCDATLNVSCVIHLKDAECIEWSKTTSVIKLQQVFDNLYVTLNSGVFVIVPLPCEGISELRAFDSNVRCVSQVSWSPDFERTILIDDSSSVVSVLCVANDEYEKLNEFSLQDVEDEENKFVNLGWGSVETQFRGTEGKLSTPKSNQNNLGDDNPNDAIEIVWKKNSSSFAVSYLCRQERRRKVKIFNQNGILLNVTKDVCGLQNAMDWCSSRNLIFVVQKLSNKTVTCFLEENGLRHGEFPLPENFMVERLSWNNEGTILATLGKQQNDNVHVVLFWTTSNYKWYIKHKLSFKKRVVYLQWDDTAPGRIHLLLSTGLYRMFEWMFDTAESREFFVNGQDSKFIASIDGATVYLTNYGDLFQPMSICENTCAFSSYVNAFVFANSTREFSFADNSIACENNVNVAPSLALLYLSNNLICLYDAYRSIVKSVDVPQMSFDFTFYRGNKNENVRSIQFETAAEITAWLWLPEYKSLYFCWTRIDGYYFCVSEFCFESRHCVISKTIKVVSRILIIKNYKREAIVHLENGAILIYRDGKLRSSGLTLKEPCIRMQILNSKMMIALSENYNLYVNELIKWRDIRSFCWRRPFLVGITSNHRLVIAKVKKNNFTDILNRRIEPKSHLITIVGDRILLKADRGNIELITPRPFVAVKMSTKLLAGNYLEVFKLLRKQRINLNVLFDHNPYGFLSNIKQICQEIRDPSYLTLFVMELENSNVARRVFSWKYQHHSVIQVKVSGDNDNKVQRVCEALFAAMQELKSAKLILPTIAVLVRLNKLSLAAEYAIENNEIAFLFQLADSRSVYEASLASYDLTRALRIAEFSKIDPGDYLPLIENLQKMSSNYRKFKINDYLGNRSEALKYLSYCDEDCYFEECLEYIEKNQMYANALEIFTAKLKSPLEGDEHVKRTTNARYLKIASIFGQNLVRDGRFQEAAVIFEKTGLYDKVLECYSTTGNWHATVSLIQSMHLKESVAADLYSKLHSSLSSERRYEDAGFVAFVFLKNASLATKSYILAHKYMKAIDAARSHGCFSLVLPSLKSKLHEAAEIYMNEFHSNISSLEKYVDRLKHINEVGNLQSVANEESDRFSHSGSYASSESGTSCSTDSSRRSTASSSTSAKRIRRRERKLWNLKPGNPREKPSLLYFIRELIISSGTDFFDSVAELVDALVRIEEYNVARKLRDQSASYFNYINQVVSDIWKADDLDEEGGFKELLSRCPPTLSVAYNRNEFYNILPL